MLGDNIFLTPSWGRNEIVKEYDIKLPKPVMSSVDVAELVYDDLRSQTGLQGFGDVVNMLIYHCSITMTTFGYKHYIDTLKTVWTDLCLPLRDQHADTEFKMCIKLITHLKTLCPEGNVISKNTVRKELLRVSINLLMDV